MTASGRGGKQDPVVGREEDVSPYAGVKPQDEKQSRLIGEPE